MSLNSKCDLTRREYEAIHPSIEHFNQNVQYTVQSKCSQALIRPDLDFIIIDSNLGLDC